jgi:YHS domain-containing protein
MFRLLIVLGGLLIAFFLLKSMGKKHRRPSSFRSPSFEDVRKEKDMGELVKDPVSGTYIPKGKATSRKVDGQEYFFESEENAIEFLESYRRKQNQ